MIRLKNLSDFTITLRKAGAMAAATDIDAAVVPVDATLIAVLARVGTKGTAGSGASAKVAVDVNKNGTTILTTNKITFPYAATQRNPDSYGDAAQTSFSKGDTVSFDIDAVFDGSGPTQPTNFSIVLVFRRKGPLPAGIITDAVEL